MKFKHGDRVCFSAAPALGTVIISERGNRVSDDCVRVQWDGKKRRETFHESLLKAAAAESGRTKWQPIETAPRTGEIVLARFENRDGKMWLADLTTGEWGTEVNEWEGKPFWCWLSDSGMENPTHWMPLPDPPSADAEPESKKPYAGGNAASEPAGEQETGKV